jgi:two-component system, LytTR family, sensor kinase
MPHQNLLLRYKLHHVLFWLLVLGIWFFLRMDDYTSRALAFKITLIKVVDLSLLIYVTNYILIPKLLYRKKYVVFTIIFIGMVFISSALKMKILGIVMGNPGMYDLSNNFKARLYDNIIPHFFLVIAGVAVKLLFDYGVLQKRMAETAKEKAETELNFLKSQINPHFLFNSLNSVYFLIDKNNKDARGALHKFSDMLRYQLYEMNGDKIPVEKEISYLRDYVDLQKLRKDEHYAVEFNCSPQVKDFSIEPLLLVPFVENAFKHISHHTDQKNLIKLDLSRRNGEFRFVVENSKDDHMKNTEQPGGIGLGNVKRRLELLYPGKYELDIVNQEKSYKVDLKIKIES